MGCTSSITLVLLLLVDILTLRMASGQHDYRDALAKSILFFEGQRSGKLPSSQRMKWRKDSALNDVLNKGNYKVDLVGGYYDAGDNLKFNFPMAFSTTMLAWSVLEFGSFMGSELEHANEAVRWGTDYLLKSTSIRDVVFVQVGEPYADHFCWERPEDMDTPRNIYAVSKKYPGSEVAGETAAALASSSIIFRSSDPSYSQMILERAMQVFEFADKYQGSYSESLGSRVCPFYCDFSGYKDELLWAAAWIYKASNNSYYWDYIMKAIPTANEDPLSIEFGWDNKGAGTNVLITNDLLAKKDASSPTIFRSNADTFICSVLPESPFKKVQYSPGGLLFKPGGSNMQNPSALSFLILAYSQYLSRTNNVVNCGGTIANAKRLVTLAKSQVDYILGNNPLKMSYMVGYGKTFPLKIHHRGSSLPSIDQHPQHISCKGGSPYYLSNDPNPNQLTGAVVGGPFPNDTYPDSRFEFRQSEPTTYINAPLVGVLAYFTSH